MVSRHGAQRIHEHCGIDLQDHYVMCLCSQSVEILALYKGIHVTEYMPMAIYPKNHLFEGALVELRAMFIIQIHSCVNDGSQECLHILFKFTARVCSFISVRNMILWTTYEIYCRFHRLLNPALVWIFHSSDFFEGNYCCLIIPPHRGEIFLHYFDLPFSHNIDFFRLGTLLNNDLTVVVFTMLEFPD